MLLVYPTYIVLIKHPVVNVMLLVYPTYIVLIKHPVFFRFDLIVLQ
jgi:hypothetical protein